MVTIRIEQVCGYSDKYFITMVCQCEWYH